MNDWGLWAKSDFSKIKVSLQLALLVFCYFVPFFLPIFLKEAPLQNDLLWVFWHEVKSENNRGQWERHFFCSFKESEQEGIYCAGLSPLNTIARFISNIFLEFLLFAHFSSFQQHVIWYRSYFRVLHKLSILVTLLLLIRYCLKIHVHSYVKHHIIKHCQSNALIRTSLPQAPLQVFWWEDKNVPKSNQMHTLKKMQFCQIWFTN